MLMLKIMLEKWVLLNNLKDSVTSLCQRGWESVSKVCQASMPYAACFNDSYLAH